MAKKATKKAAAPAKKMAAKKFAKPMKGKKVSGPKGMEY